MLQANSSSLSIFFHLARKRNQRARIKKIWTLVAAPGSSSPQRIVRIVLRNATHMLSPYQKGCSYRYTDCRVFLNRHKTLSFHPCLYQNPCCIDIPVWRTLAKSFDFYCFFLGKSKRFALLHYCSFPPPNEFNKRTLVKKRCCVSFFIVGVF